MKKHNISQFFKSKNFYVVLFVAVIAISAVTVVGINMKSDKTKQKNLADLNTPINIAKNEETSIGEDSKDAANKTDAATNDATVQEAKGKLTNEELFEYDLGSDSYDESAVENKETENTEIATENTNSEQVTEVADEDTEDTVSVMKPATAENLKFSSDSKITWPVKGNVIMPFSVDKGIHFATLGEWKVNPAIMISSETGQKVVAATKGVVSSVTLDEETGTTVTMNIGNGYEIVYGQLTDVTLAAGDIVEEGANIGKVANPTKYYSVEGSNLYLKMLCDGTPVNPMLFLAGEE